MSPHSFALSAVIFSARKNIPVARCRPDQPRDEKRPAGIRNEAEFRKAFEERCFLGRNCQVAGGKQDLHRRRQQSVTAQITGFSSPRMARIIGL